MQDLKQDLKEIKNELVFIRVETSKNSVSLENHMKRTEINERRLEKLEYTLLGLLITVVGAALVKWLIS
jgi:hypothetical protein